MGTSCLWWNGFRTVLFFALILNSGDVCALEFGFLETFASLDSLRNVSIFFTAIQAASLEGYVSHLKKTTLLAPNNAAFERAFKNHSLSCLHEYYLVMPCNSFEQLLESTNLRQLLLNHVLIGEFPVNLLEKTRRLEFIGDAVVEVQRKGGQTYVGNSLVLEADIGIQNGLVHILDNVLESIDSVNLVSADISINSSSLIPSMKLADADFFDNFKRDEMAKGARLLNIPAFQANRGMVGFPDGGLHDPPVLTFDPSSNTHNFCFTDAKFHYPMPTNVTRPQNDEDIAFMTVVELGALIRTKQITSQELVKIYFSRLERYNCILQVVITYTKDLAYEQAAGADELTQKGVYLGPLHGIPYGLKDIISVPKYRTTWGSGSYKHQVIDEEAWVYQRLKNAGAVLVAKLVCGSLAYDDIWFGGRTRNPWNIEEFSTGSSSGPAASVSAGGKCSGFPRCRNGPI